MNDAQLPLFRPPPARRSAPDGPGTALGQSPLSPPSPPARSVLEPPGDSLSVRRTILSADRLYRYTLYRQWGQGTVYAMFIGLNPSTADENVDDPTIRKCIGFAQRWGFDALCMTNLFAFRATEPRKMKGHSKPIGDENDRWLVAAAREASVIVAAWGVNGQFMGRDEEVLKLLDDVQCLRTTKDGHPEHPLYVPYDTPLKPYPIRTLQGPAKASGASGPLPSPSPVGKTGRSAKPERKTGHPGGELPGVPAALAARLVPILRRAGYILPGDPAWRSPDEEPEIPIWKRGGHMPKDLSRDLKPPTAKEP
jgi:hypothetical protein